MVPTRRAVLGAAVTVSTAGCSADGDGDCDGTTPTDGATATVQVGAHDDLGEILVDADGATLYMFDQDTQGENASACAGDCASAWPPLTVDGSPTTGPGVTADLTTFDRSDGSTQVAAGGWPLYYFASDESPGDAAGQVLNDVWWVLDPDGTPVRTSGSGTATATPTETAGGGIY